MTDNLKWLILCAKEKNVFGRILGLEEDSRDMERLQSIYKVSCPLLCYRNNGMFPYFILTVYRILLVLYNRV